MNASGTLFNQPYQALLLDLLAIDTVTPMETGQPSPLASASERYCQHACALGFTPVAQLTGAPSDDLPLAVQRQYQAMGDDFFRCQPSIALGLGNWQQREKTLMFNFHMDTVGPMLPVSHGPKQIAGRGVIDNKGPGVAVLAAVEGWLATRAADDDTGVLIQLVAGEEGGAMGTYGTRLLCDQGYYGALNLFVIPSGGKYYDCSTVSMTVEIAVDGTSATDDSPSTADNATVILASLVDSLSRELAPQLAERAVKMTVAGLHTGEMHNRVYGSGRLLINFAYRSAAAGDEVGTLFAAAFARAKAHFCQTFAPLSLFRQSADGLDRTLSFRWLKRGLPVLNNRHAGFEALLAGADIARHHNAEHTFTCDAMWGQRADAYSIMYGPGALALNGAHTAQEAISPHELEAFSQSVLRLLNAFSRTSAHAPLPASGATQTPARTLK